MLFCSSVLYEWVTSVWRSIGMGRVTITASPLTSKPLPVVVLCPLTITPSLTAVTSVTRQPYLIFGDRKIFLFFDQPAVRCGFVNLNARSAVPKTGVLRFSFHHYAQGCLADFPPNYDRVEDCRKISIKNQIIIFMMMSFYEKNGIYLFKSFNKYPYVCTNRKYFQYYNNKTTSNLFDYIHMYLQRLQTGWVGTLRESTDAKHVC